MYKWRTLSLMAARRLRLAPFRVYMAASDARTNPLRTVHLVRSLKRQISRWIVRNQRQQYGDCDTQKNVMARDSGLCRKAYYYILGILDVACQRTIQKKEKRRCRAPHVSEVKVTHAHDLYKNRACIDLDSGEHS